MFELFGSSCLVCDHLFDLFELFGSSCQETREQCSLLTFSTTLASSEKNVRLEVAIRLVTNIVAFATSQAPESR